MIPQKPRYKATITREDINALPIKAFDGQVFILTTPQEATHAFEEVAQYDIVGFDTETRPTFRKGQYHDVSLIQLAIPEKVFLIRLHQTKAVNSMITFLEDSKTIKAGVGLQNDLKALYKLHPFKPNGFIELSKMAKAIGLQVESVRKLAGLILGFRISKSAQVSNWEATKYTEKQIRYAATDAWVCLKLYEKLATEMKQLVGRVDPTTNAPKMF